VAATVAALAESDSIEPQHVAEALSFRAPPDLSV
jgi:predicted ATPase with chaperone activity